MNIGLLLSIISTIVFLIIIFIQLRVILAKNRAALPTLDEGEKYAGLLLGKSGEPDRHIILLDGDNDAADWQTQMDWAKSNGGDLPTRRMQPLLFANLPEEFKQDWYWSCEQRGSGSAWLQTFNYGIQLWDYANLKCRARAVRSVSI